MPVGILNLLKPKGETSHDMVQFVRRLFREKKAGHLGTLDPAAVGVLPVCVGKATRISEYLIVSDKAYRAEISLGTTTDTGDATGRVITRKKVPQEVDFYSLQNICKKFEGQLWQTPPMYSAIKYKGKKLYELARKGYTIKRSPREVKIFRLKPLCYINKTSRFIFDIECSKGTYIRSLASQIGEEIGCGAHLSFLLRTRAGAFTIASAYTRNELQSLSKKDELCTALEPMDKALAHFSYAVVSGSAISLIANGVSLKESQLEHLALGADTGYLKIYDQQDNFLAIARAVKCGRELVIKPEKVFV